MGFREKHNAAFAERETFAVAVEDRTRELFAAQQAVRDAEIALVKADEKFFKEILPRVKHVVTVAVNAFEKETRHIERAKRPNIPVLGVYRKLREIQWESAKFKKLDDKRLVFSVMLENQIHSDDPFHTYSVPVPLEWLGWSDGDISRQMRERISNSITKNQKQRLERRIRTVNNNIRRLSRIKNGSEEISDKLAEYVSENKELQRLLTHE